MRHLLAALSLVTTLLPAVPAPAEERAPAEEPAPRLTLRALEGVVPVLELPDRRQTGKRLALSLDLGTPRLHVEPDAIPLVVEVDTVFGSLEIEFFSMPNVEWRGSILLPIHVATVEAAPAAIFDRTEIPVSYVVAVPVARF